MTKQMLANWLSSLQLFAAALLVFSANNIPLKRCTVRPAYAIFFIYFKSTEIVAAASLSLVIHKTKQKTERVFFICPTAVKIALFTDL